VPDLHRLGGGARLRATDTPRPSTAASGSIDLAVRRTRVCGVVDAHGFVQLACAAFHCLKSQSSRCRLRRSCGAAVLHFMPMEIHIKRSTRFLTVVTGLPFLLPGRAAEAHGFAGERFFPATLQTDDPFVADEMSLPTLTKNPTDPSGGQSYSAETDIAKRLTTDFGLTASYQWNYFQPKGAPPFNGFGSLRTGAQYQLFVNAPHQFMGLVGLNTTWGHTGAVNHGGADDHTTLEPTFDFGKGFGDLPDSLLWLKPLAITGNLSVDFPTKVISGDNLNQNVFNAGFAIEYSLEYLQHHVKDIGLRAPFDRLIPLVEVTSATPLNRDFNTTTGLTNGTGNATTGVIAPGFIWAGQYFQIGAEAIIPYGQGQRNGVGGVLQFHLFLDDLFPNSIGRPLLGNTRLFGS
jgi:hypothetical protein